LSGWRRAVNAKDYLRRVTPTSLAALVLVLGALSLAYAWVMALHLRDDARETSLLMGRVFAGLNDPSPDAAAEALFDLAAQVRGLGIPIAVTDTTGRVTAYDNAPFDAGADTATVRAWVARLDRIHTPLTQPGVGQIHYGALPAARRFTVLAVLQVAMLGCLVLFGLWAFRWRVESARDRLWVAMARESAHQLGTPLMSLTGWIAYLREHPDTPAAAITEHLQADAERLERVAKRFERIGRPARQEPLGLGAVAERVVNYFRPRLPALASAVHLELQAPGAGPTALGDPVLIEWALEALLKNAVDALSGRGGHIRVVVESRDGSAYIHVVDDGPGVSPEVKAQLFEPGVTTKKGGWGLGLALARRIVERQHGGRLAFHPAPGGGSEFVLQLPVIAAS
jgi:signal transduction histidine kinase